MIQATRPLSGKQMRLLERAIMKTEITGEVLRACLASNSIPPEVERMLLDQQVAIENGNLNLLSVAHTEPDRDQATSVPTVAFLDGTGDHRLEKGAEGMECPQALVKRDDVNAFLEWTEAGIGEWRSIALSALEVNRKLRAELNASSSVTGLKVSLPVDAHALEGYASMF